MRSRAIRNSAFPTTAHFNGHRIIMETRITL